MKAEFTTKQMIEIKSENLAEARMLADLGDNPDLQIRQLRSDTDHNPAGIITTTLVIGWKKREPALTPAKQKALCNEALELSHLSQLLEWQQDLTKRRLDVIKKELGDEAVKAPVMMFKSAAERVHKSEEQPSDQDLLKANQLDREILNKLFGDNPENRMLRNGKMSREFYSKIAQVLDLRQHKDGGDYLIYGKSFRDFEIVDPDPVTSLADMLSDEWHEDKAI